MAEVELLKLAAVVKTVELRDVVSLEVELTKVDQVYQPFHTIDPVLVKSQLLQFAEAFERVVHKRINAVLLQIEVA